MKRVLFILTLIGAGFLAHAQQEKGDKVIRFSGSYSQYGSADGTLTLDLKYGYFVTKNIELGITPAFSISSALQLVNLGVYGTYNFLTDNAKFVPYIGAHVSDVETTVSVPGADDISTSSFGVGGYAGFRYFMTEFINFDTGVSYDVGDIDALNINFGIGVIIGKRK